MSTTPSLTNRVPPSLPSAVCAVEAGAAETTPPSLEPVAISELSYGDDDDTLPMFDATGDEA